MEIYCQKGHETWNIREEWATDRERWKYTVRRDMKLGTSGRNGSLTGNDGKTQSGGTWKPGTSGRNGPLTGNNGNILSEGT